MNRSRTRNTLLILATATGAPLFMIGCSGTSPEAFRSDPTPMLQARGETQDDIDNNLAHTSDTNGRNVLNDLGRMFFSDRPSRLTPGPKPY